MSFNTKDTPLIFQDTYRAVWVKVCNVSAQGITRMIPGDAYEVAIDSMAKVSALVFAIEAAQVQVKNSYRYGNGVMHIINSVDGSIAPRSSWVCNLFLTNTEEAPIYFYEQRAPVNETSALATEVLVQYRTFRSGTTSSEKSATKRPDEFTEALADATAGN